MRGEYTYLYKTKAWRILRESQLAKEPLCCRCLNRGIETLANVANHKIPHKGDTELFLDEGNLESTCKTCHDSDIKSQELSGYSYDTMVGSDGMPIDSKHPFYA